MITTFEEIIGTKCVKAYIDDDSNFILHLIKDGKKFQFRLYHEQDCSESVTLDDVVGDLSDLIDTIILDASETSEGGMDADNDSYTWTFYHFATIKGYVDLKWFGVSNGYYSEDVDVEIIELPNN